jgi:hypothetical protein
MRYPLFGILESRENLMETIYQAGGTWYGSPLRVPRSIRPMERLFAERCRRLCLGLEFEVLGLNVAGRRSYL